MKTHTFKGGVHPHEMKEMSNSCEIADAFPSTKTVTIPVTMGGAPNTVLVKVGDVVKRGQIIAKSDKFMSAPVHASISGKVKKIQSFMVTGCAEVPCITIESDGSGETDFMPPLDPFACTKEEALGRIRDAGIVGMGGACFPTHVKLCPPKECTIDTLIINAVECEPYLTADHRLMLEYPDQILIGIKVILKVLGIDRAVIGIEANKPDAIELMRTKTAMVSGIEVMPLKMKYPQGGEKQLIEAVTGRQVPPPPALPANVGCVVQNVGTVFAIYEAVMKNKPLFERIVTVTGQELRNPCNLKVRMGTPVSQLIEYAGGMPEDTGKLISGGPMMGRPLLDDTAPVVKGTSGLLMIPEADAIRREERNCIRCAK